MGSIGKPVLPFSKHMRYDMSIFNFLLQKKEREIIQLRKQLKQKRITGFQFYLKLYDLDIEMYENQVPADIDLEISKYKLQTSLTRKFNSGEITKDEFVLKIKDVDIDKWKQYATEKELKEYELEQQFHSKEISENDYYRELATLDNRPYINITNIEMDTKGVGTHSIEFDWNDKFIQHLKDNGFTGNTDEELVDKWFVTVSTAIAQESDAVIVTDPDDFTKLTHSGKTEHY